MFQETQVKWRTLTALISNKSINGSAKTFVPTGNKVYVSLGVTGGSGAGVGKITKPQIELGSTPSTYEPYANICPISGWTGAKVTVAGVNVFDIDNAVVVSGSTMYGTKAHFPQGTTLYAMRKGGTSSSLYGLLEDGSVESITSINTDNHKYTITLSKDYYGILLSFYARREYKNNNGALMVSVEDFTDVEPYNGTTYEVTWQTEAGTVYGGTLDVTTGELVVDKAEVDLGTLNWQYSGDNYNHRFSATMPSDYANPTSASDRADMICSSYVANANVVSSIDALGISGYQGLGSVFIRDLAYIDSVAFKAAMSGVQLVYKLATPQTYQLSPTEVLTLLGENNIFADCGDIENVTYRADTKKYVDGTIVDIPLAMIAPIETGTTASKAYAVGEYFILNGNQFCKAISAIASGATFTLNTNYTVTTIGAELKALQ